MASITMKASDVRISAEFALTNLMELKTAWLNIKIKEIGPSPWDDAITAVGAAHDMAKFVGDDAQMQVSSEEFAAMQENLPAR